MKLLPPEVGPERRIQGSESVSGKNAVLSFTLEVLQRAVWEKPHSD